MTWRWPWVSREVANVYERRRVSEVSSLTSERDGWRSLYERAFARTNGDAARFATALDRIVDANAKLADQAEARYGDLLAKYHALKLQGGAIPEPPIIPAAVERAEPSEITKVIREQCETAGGRIDNALARHLRSYAKQLKRAGKTDDEIVGALVTWQTSESDGISSETVN